MSEKQINSLVEPSKEKSGVVKNRNWPYVGLEHLESGVNEIKMWSESTESISINNIFHCGNTLFGKLRPNLRKAAYAKFEGYCSTDIIVLQAKDNVDPLYVSYICQSEIVFGYAERTAIGTGMPRTSWNDISKLKVFFHTSLAEQRKIARILSCVDAVMEKTEAAIEKHKAIKQGMMQDLFTRGIDIKTGKLRPRYEDAPELYKETELGWVPKEWKIKPLEQLTTQIGDGIHTTPKYSTNTDYFFINGNNITEGNINITNDTPCVSEEEYRKHFKELNNRTILYSINGTIGNIAFYNYEKVILGKSAAYISCDKSINLDYVYFILQTEPIIKYYGNEVTGSTIKNLSLATIRNTPISYPKDSVEQNEIAKRIISVNKKIKAEQSCLIKQKRLKQALMSDLLTGKVRVKYEEEQKEAV